MILIMVMLDGENAGRIWIFIYFCLNIIPRNSWNVVFWEWETIQEGQYSSKSDMD